MSLVFSPKLNSKSTSVGGKHLVSSQTINVKYPLTYLLSALNSTICLNVAFLVNLVTSIKNIGSCETLLFSSTSTISPTKLKYLSDSLLLSNSKDTGRGHISTSQSTSLLYISLEYIAQPGSISAMNVSS